MRQLLKNDAHASRRQSPSESAREGSRWNVTFSVRYALCKCSRLQCPDDDVCWRWNGWKSSRWGSTWELETLGAMRLNVAPPRQAAPWLAVTNGNYPRRNNKTLVRKLLSPNLSPLLPLHLPHPPHPQWQTASPH
jgi:hypothetical protein